VIETFAGAIFATGIPALEALGVALLGVESMAGPLLAVAAAIIAIGVAASGSSPSVDDIKKKIAELENEGGIAGFFDFNRQGKIDTLKEMLANREKALADSVAAEQAALAERDAAWKKSNDAALAAGNAASNAIAASMDKETEA